MRKAYWAGRYGAFVAGGPPFLLVERGPLTEGEREALRSPAKPARRGSIFKGPLLPPDKNRLRPDKENR